MAVKKKIEVNLKINGSTVIVNDGMSEDDIDSAIGFTLQCNDKLDELKGVHTTANTQLESDNKELSNINNKLNFNIEIQVMMLNKLKAEVGEDKYGKIREQVITCPEFLKLKSRAGL